MTAAVKLTVFTVVLAVVFALSLALGAAVGPFDDGPSAPSRGHAGMDQ